MRKRLARSVQMYSETGDLIVFLPGDEPPEEYAKLISNPAAWEDEKMAAPVPSDGSYEERTVAELLSEARERNIDLQGATKKADVIARLEAADAGSQ